MKLDGTFYAPRYETNIAKEVVELQCDILTPDVLFLAPKFMDLLNVSHVLGGKIQFMEYWTSQLPDEVLITTPVNGMKRSPLSLGTYKSTTNKRHLPQTGDKKKGGGKKKQAKKKRAPTQQGLAAGGKLGWMPISARQDLTSFMLNSPVSWLWSDGSHALYTNKLEYLRLRHVT